jgi:type IV pilus assembly protein PilA
MLTALRKRLTKDDEGFTLIELMVVVLIIAILIAIAIPTFLGAQDRARDRGAQSDLRNAVTAAKTIATDDAGKFTNVNAASLLSAEGALTFVSGAPGDDEVGVFATASSVVLIKESASGEVFGTAADETGKVVTCRDAAAITTFADCESGEEW